MTTPEPNELEPRAEVLHEAAALITGDRNKAYGTPTQNFANIAALWNVQFAHLLRDDAKFEPRHVAEALIHLKLARNIADPKRDNWVDLAGYAGCGYETTLPQPEESTKSEPDPLLGVLTPPPNRSVWVTHTPPYITTNSEPGDHAVAARRIQEEINNAHGAPGASRS